MFEQNNCPVKIKAKVRDRSENESDDHPRGYYQKKRQSAVDNTVLQSCPPGGFGVRDARESDHGIEREINSGQRGFKEVVEFLFCTERARRGFVAHLDKVFQREAGEGFGVYFAALEIFSERTLSILRK